MMSAWTRASIVDDHLIGQWDQAFDVVRATFTEAELEAAQEQVAELFDDPDAGLESARHRDDDAHRHHLAARRTDRGACRRAVRRVPTDRVCVARARRSRPIALTVSDPVIPLEVIIVPGMTARSRPHRRVLRGHDFPLSALDTAVPVAEYGDPQLIVEATPS